MTPRQEALRLIAQAGADLTDRGGFPTELHLNVWTPSGVMWSATLSHSLSIDYATDRAAGWLALLDDLRAGVESCTQPECESCG